MATVPDISWTVDGTKGSLSYTRVQDVVARVNAGVKKSAFTAANQVVVSSAAGAYGVVTIPEGAIIGKGSSGVVAALTAAEVQAVLGGILTDGSTPMAADLPLGATGLENLLGGGGIAAVTFDTYAGDDTSDRAVTTGFVVDFLQVMGDDGVFGEVARGMTHFDHCNPSNMAYETVDTDKIAIDASDGFSVGNSATHDFNALGVTYTYLALKFS